MKINVMQGITDYEGNAVETNKLNAKGEPVIGEDHKPVMEPEKLRTYFINALNSTLPGEALTAENKAQIYYLSNKLFRSKEVDLTESDIEFIKDRVGKVFGPLIYGRICDIFDGKVEVPAKETTTEIPTEN